MYIIKTKNSMIYAKLSHVKVYMHAFVHKACISEEMKYLLVSTTCKLLNTSYLETK